MKTKVFAISLTAVIGLTGSYNAEALWHPFKKKSGDPATHTERKGIFTRATRYARQRFAAACDSTNAGKIDGFRRCLASSLGSSISPDKASSVLALDSNGKPLFKTISRTEYRQGWFRRWNLLSRESAALLSGLNDINTNLKAAENAFQEAGGDLGSLQDALENQQNNLFELWDDALNSQSPSSTLPTEPLPKNENSKLDALQEKVATIYALYSNMQYELNTVWESFYSLSAEIAKVMGGSPQFVDTRPKDANGNPEGSPPLTTIPSPNPLDPIFAITRNIPNSPLMNASFAASLEEFARKNENVMENFCNNFFNTTIDPNATSGGGYEADYVRLADTGDISPAMIEAYQTNKLANISMKCSEASMTGLVWRKLYSLCNLETQGSGIPACDNFSSAEVATSQTKSS
jgi:archaellum component FlaC